MFGILANIPFFLKREHPFVFFLCPSLDWLDRAKRVTSFAGSRFTVAFPAQYKDDHFLGSVRVGSSCMVYVGVTGCDRRFERLCSAVLENFEKTRVKNLQDKYLKGILGLQYVEQLVAWLNSQDYLERMSVGEGDREPLRDNDFMCLAEFRVIGQAQESTEYGIADLSLAYA